jgi:hypothetical protein
LLVPDAGDPPEPYPDFTARAIGCGPGRIPSTSAERAEGQAKAAAATQVSPSKAR